MGATSDNYQIVTSGITYTIASDYVNPLGGETAHFQIVKIAHGANDTVTFTSGNNPLPVGVCGAWDRYEYLASSGYYSLATTIVGITGTSLTVVGVSGGVAVGVTFGTVSVTATDLDIRNLYGGTVGSGLTADTDYVAIQGLCGAYPVGITTSSSIPVTVTSLSNLGVFGVTGATAVYVQASNFNIRGLTAASDTITVYGGGTASTVSVGLFGFTGATADPIYAENNALNVNIKTAPGITVTAADLDIRAIDYTADTITVVGQGATDNATSPRATVPTYINALSQGGSLLQVGGVTGAGWSAAALNVNLVNSGITFTVSASATFSAEIGITAPYTAPIPMQGSTHATFGVWVTGSTSGDPVTVRGYSSGYLPVEIGNFTTQTDTINTNITNVKNNTDFLAAMKKALYSDALSVGAFDFSDKYSIYTLVRDEVASPLTTLKNAIMTNAVMGAVDPATQDTLAVAVVATKQQPTFMARTGYVGYSAKSLTEFNAVSGFTCSTGIRVKASRVATGASASSNEFMCIISEADVATYGATATQAAYTLYHGEEMFIEVDNINKLRVFYPPYSVSFAPNNTGPGMTFSFYAS